MLEIQVWSVMLVVLLPIAVVIALGLWVLLQAVYAIIQLLKKGGDEPTES